MRKFGQFFMIDNQESAADVYWFYGNKEWTSLYTVELTTIESDEEFSIDGDMSHTWKARRFFEPSETNNG